MKKSFKCFCLCLALVICLLGVSNLKVLAASLDDTQDEVQKIEMEQEEVLRYVPCPVGPGKHAMRPKGWGSLYEGPPQNCTLVFKMGAVSQCQYCHLVVVSQCDPDLGLLGIYAMENPGYELSKTGTVLYKYADDILYNSSLKDDPIFAGFEWSRVR